MLQAQSRHVATVEVEHGQSTYPSISRLQHHTSIHIKHTHAYSQLILSPPPCSGCRASSVRREQLSRKSRGSRVAIDATSVHRLHAGQVVLELQGAVKELVENSLDAGATSVEVRFKDNGLDSVEVVDNGSGIPQEDWEMIGEAPARHSGMMSRGRS